MVFGARSCFKSSIPPRLGLGSSCQDTTDLIRLVSSSEVFVLVAENQLGACSSIDEPQRRTSAWVDVITVSKS